MGGNKIFIAIAVITIFLLFGVVFAAGKMTNDAKVATSSDAKVELSTTSYDWGEIGINNGQAEAVFEIKNIGSQTLKLFNATTSCACTTAQLQVGDKLSPLFGMHTKSAYVTDVPPGETAKVKAVFDPLFHGPNGLGPISRQVTLSTNDPGNPSLTLLLSAVVIK